MITVDQALEIVLDHTRKLDNEIVELTEAHGRILAQDLHADMDLPPFDRSRMDGYAVKAEDLSRVPARLKVIGEIAAGSSFSGQLKEGEAVKIFTGAPLPAGANAVQKVEVTEAEKGHVLILESVKPGQFITKLASEVSKGDVVAQAGRQIASAEMAVLSSFGYSKVQVGIRPRVAVLSTGSELVEVAEVPKGAQIRNSNTHVIAAYAREAGAESQASGIIPDDIAATREALSRASSEHDVVITSGGVSMGDYDLVKAALLELGATIHFDKVSIRPGKPTVFATLGDTYFFGLPGNPVSTSVTFNVFVRPALRKMMGVSFPVLSNIQAELGEI